MNKEIIVQKYNRTTGEKIKNEIALTERDYQFYISLENSKNKPPFFYKIVGEKNENEVIIYNENDNEIENKLNTIESEVDIIEEKAEIQEIKKRGRKKKSE